MSEPVTSHQSQVAGNGMTQSTTCTIGETALVELIRPGTWALSSSGPWGSIAIHATCEWDYVLALAHARNLIQLELNRLPRAEDLLEDALAGARRQGTEEFGPAHLTPQPPSPSAAHDAASGEGGFAYGDCDDPYSDGGEAEPWEPGPGPLEAGHNSPCNDGRT